MAEDLFGCNGVEVTWRNPETGRFKKAWLHPQCRDEAYRDGIEFREDDRKDDPTMIWEELRALMEKPVIDRRVINALLDRWPIPDRPFCTPCPDLCSPLAQKLFAQTGQFGQVIGDTDPAHPDALFLPPRGADVVVANLTKTLEFETDRIFDRSLYLSEKGDLAFVALLLPIEFRLDRQPTKHLDNHLTAVIDMRFKPLRPVGVAGKIFEQNQRCSWLIFDWTADRLDEGAMIEI